MPVCHTTIYYSKCILFLFSILKDMQWKHIGTEATAAKFGKKTMVSNEKNVNLVGYQ